VHHIIKESQILGYMVLAKKAQTQITP